MELDPHTLHQIIQRIEQQMRCPQCSGKVPVDVTSVRMTGDDFLLLQLKCSSCDAYIVLHAAVQGMKDFKADADPGTNASSSLCLKVEEVHALRDSLKDAGGSFERLFQEAQKQNG